jgi:hypothetical protein
MHVEFVQVRGSCVSGLAYETKIQRIKIKLRNTQKIKYNGHPGKNTEKFNESTQKEGEVSELTAKKHST